MQVLQHPWMTSCSPLPRVNEIEDEVREYVAGKLKPDENRLLGQVLKPAIRLSYPLVLVTPSKGTNA